MTMTMDTVANSYIEAYLHPGQRDSSSPFQVIGVRPKCTIEEVEKRGKELRINFHPDKMDDKLAKHLSHNFRGIFSEEACTSDCTTYCICHDVHFIMIHMHVIHQ